MEAHLQFFSEGRKALKKPSVTKNMVHSLRLSVWLWIYLHKLLPKHPEACREMPDGLLTCLLPRSAPITKHLQTCYRVSSLVRTLTFLDDDKHEHHMAKAGERKPVYPQAYDLPRVRRPHLSFFVITSMLCCCMLQEHKLPIDHDFLKTSR